MPYSGTLFLLVGPAGVGKNSIMRRAIEKLKAVPLRQMPTVTTRGRRPDEQEGREHYFRSLDEFRSMIANQELIEYQEVYPGTFYGTPRQPLQTALEIGAKLIADIDVVGAHELKTAFPDNVILISIAPPSSEVLEGRLRIRGNMSEAEIAERLKRALWELSLADQSDHHVINDTVERASDAVCAIINENLPQVDPTIVTQVVVPVSPMSDLSDHTPR